MNKAFNPDATTAKQVCSSCGKEIELVVGYYDPEVHEATYTKEKYRGWGFYATQQDEDVLNPRTYYYTYEEVLGPKIPTTRYTLEDEYGVLEYWLDESTGEYFLDLEGSPVALEEIRLPETRVEAKEETDEEPGNTEYFICSNGRYYKVEDGKYVEIAEGSWVIYDGEFETFDLRQNKSVFTGQNAEVTCDGDGDVMNGYALLFGSEAHITAAQGMKIKRIKLTRVKYYDFADDVGIYVNGRDVSGTSVDGNTFMFYNINASQVDIWGDFNLNVQEVPHLLGGGMNCPSAARLTFG